MENDLKEICPIQANRQIPPNPPFSKGEKALGFDGILQRSSPPFEREAGRDFKEGRLKPPNCSYKAVLQKGEIE